ncbi:choline TMA-lyase-activating enzyme [uncultured Anaerococcus sp.]|uniref:choline TMA-lyase-activating enzyme n=1 Tax=uncultured Anaerococcus sp. TaxID=293428 RepID=UPI00288A1A66|nr:choline TMA-lyase-activating enzyme [uncultured Anaerococcus sp.]
MDNLKNDPKERTARIFNIQKYNVHDGPGVRSLVFFKGCPLRCKWCSNPEGLRREHQVMMKKNLCINCGQCVDVCPKNIHHIEDGIHKVKRDITCIGCRQCEKNCMQKAIEIVGEDKPISEIMKTVREDKDFYNMSGGGLTVGGGECTSQAESLIALLDASRLEGINTAIETCGYTKRESLEKIKDHVDIFLFDIKHMDPIKHKDLTGVNNEIILENLKYLLENGKRVKVRMPMLKGVNDSKEEIMAVVNFLNDYKCFKNFEGIDLLPYHRFGVGKYDQLDMTYPIEGDFSLSDEDLDRIQKWLDQEGLEVNIVKH